MMINPKLFICDNFEIKNVVDATLSVMCSELNMAQQFEFNKWNIEFKEGILEELCEDEIYFWSLADFYDAFVSKLADHFGIEKDFSFLSNEYE